MGPGITNKAKRKSRLSGLNTGVAMLLKVYFPLIFTSVSDEIQGIDLGKVKGVSELTLNGKTLGSKWYGAHRYNVDGLLKQGENRISIKVTTILGNYMKSLTDNEVAMRWTRQQEYYPMGLMGPVKFY